MPSIESVVPAKEIADLGFAQIGVIKYKKDKDRLQFDLTYDDNLKFCFGCVYLWTIKHDFDKSKDIILYIGHTLQGIYHRNSTWEQNLNLSSSKSNFIAKTGMKINKKIGVFGPNS